MCVAGLLSLHTTADGQQSSWPLHPHWIAEDFAVTSFTFGGNCVTHVGGVLRRCHGQLICLGNELTSTFLHHPAALCAHLFLYLRTYLLFSISQKKNLSEKFKIWSHLPLTAVHIYPLQADITSNKNALWQLRWYWTGVSCCWRRRRSMIAN